MRWISRFFWLLFLLVVFLFTVLTVNQQEVSLEFLRWRTPELSVFWWLMIAFAIGLVLGFAVASVSTVKHLLRERKLSKTVDARDRELESLRTTQTSDV